MRSMIIRNATAQDADRIREIYSYYVLHTAITYEYDVPTRKDMEQRILTTLQNYPYLVLECDGTVTGYAYAGILKNREAYQYSCEISIYLDPDVRHQGFGRLLYEALEESLKEQGIRNLYACITCPEKDDEYADHNSTLFHGHMGFSVAGTFHQCGYKFGRWYDTIWMEKLIGVHE